MYKLKGCENIYKNVKLCLILTLLFFICIGSISASEIDDNVDINLDSDNDDMELNTISESTDDDLNSEVIDSKNDSSSDIEKIPKKTSISVVNNTVARNTYLKFYLKDDEGVGVSNEDLLVKIDGYIFTVTTNSKGLGQLKLNLTADKSYYTTINFEGDDYYLGSSKSFTTKMIKTGTSLSVKSTTVVKGNSLYVILKDKNSKVLANKKVYININGKTYSRITDSSGIASLLIKYTPANSYTTKLTYKGNANYYNATKSLKVTVKKISTVLNVVNTTVAKGSDMVAYLKDKSGKPLANKKVYININGKTFTTTTNSKGKVSLLILTLSPGKKYATTLKYKGDNYYYAKTLKVNITVGKQKLSRKTKGCVWLWGTDMGKVNFNTLSKNGISNICVYVTHVSTEFKNFVKKANKYKVKIHPWVGIFYKNGKWLNPVNKDGSFNQKLFNSRINLVLQFAKIKGIGGINLDYLRYPANYGSTKKIAAVNEFTRQLSIKVKKVNPKISLSASVMPEINSYSSKMTYNEYYYGQDITTLAEYLDVIVPMVYKGNYGKNSAWIKSTTAAFVKAVDGKAEVWTGLQSYVSDSNTKRLSVAELTYDCQKALDGGADGIAFFRWGLLNMVKLS